MSNGKPTCYIKNVEVVPAEDIFGHRQAGKFVLVANLASQDHRGWEDNTPIRTSPIVSFDVEKGIFETENTNYVVVSTNDNIGI